MALSSDLVSQFVKATSDKSKEKKETITYGTVHVDTETGIFSVKLDGSNEYTPMSTTAGVADGERVVVMIKNHTAMIIGNVSSPSVRTEYVKVIETKVGAMDSKMVEFDQALGEKVTTEELYAELAKIDELEADVLDVKDRLSANEAEIDALQANDVTINGLLTAQQADISDLKTNKLDVEAAKATYATIESLNASNAQIDILKADQANFESATAQNFTAVNGSISDLQATKLSAADIEGKYANIDFSNIGQAAIEYFYATSGLIEDVVVGDGTITGKLVGVTISGDLIEGNTVKAEKLVIKGTDGLYYKLNTDGMTTEAEQTDQNSLNGSVIKAKSITATKISVSDLVAFDATIGGINIAEGAIYSGAKASVDNITAGLYLDKDGQMAIGDASNYVKYYTDSSGARRLEISADSIRFGSSKKTIESAIEEIEIGGRNLISNSAFEGLDDVIATTHSTVYSPSERMVTFTSTTVGVTPACYTKLTEYGRTNLRGSKLTLSGEYKVLTALEFGSTNPWVGYQLSIARNDTTGGSSQYIDWLGGTTISTEVTDSWTKFSATYDITDYDNTSVGVGILFRDTIGSVQFRNLKVEFGNKVTDWTPAPEDVDEAIAEAKNVDIGGRNYIVMSKLSSYSVYNSTPIAENGVISTTYQSSYAPSTASYLTLSVTGYVPPNEVMTLSGYIKVNDEIPETNYFTLRASTYGPIEGSFREYDPVTGYFRFTQTYDGTSAWILHTTTIRESGSSDVITFEKLKFEKGNKPTDWTPAPEDMATADEVEEVASIANDAQTRVSAAEALIEVLSESISMLVTDGNGASLMTQTDTGWTFSTAEMQALINRTSEGLSDLTSEVGDVNNTVSILQQAVDDLGEIAEYVKIGTYEDEPCIELGEGDSDFKLRITNTRMIFTEGSVVLAYFNNQSLHIKKAVVEEELQQGGFVWKVRSNGNMGLVWKGVTS